MKSERAPLRGRTHYGIVFDVSPEGFDSGSVNSGSIFVDRDDPETTFLFYSGSRDAKMAHSSIGVAASHDMLRFRRVEENPILEGNSHPFNDGQLLTPSVARVGNRFYMVFSGRHSTNKSRRIGIAYAEDPKGPWHILGEILKPTHLWEGMQFDNGPTLVKLGEETLLVFYSTITNHSKYDILAYLRGYPLRRIGIAKVKVRGPSLSQIEVCKNSTNPIKHLNEAKGSWNESVFCPGYFRLNNVHYMVPAASTYSIGFPFKQYIGITSSKTLDFKVSCTAMEKLIDGPSEKSEIMPSIKSQICLDSPSPLLTEDRPKLFLYYSVADRSGYVWRIALTAFDLQR